MPGATVLGMPRDRDDSKLRPDVNEIAFRTAQAALGEAEKPSPPGEGEPNAEANGEHAETFMRDLVGRLAHRIQLTTDQNSIYLLAVENAFGWQEVDYAMLHKVYGADPQGQRRYSPPTCLGTMKQRVMGNQRPSTSARRTSSGLISGCGCTRGASPG